MLSKRKLKNSVKNLSATLQVKIDPLVNKLEFTNNKRPSKPSLPNVLEPSRLMLLTDFLESCFHQLFGSRNTPDCIRQASLASFGKSLKLPKFQNTLYTLNRCGQEWQRVRFGPGFFKSGPDSRVCLKNPGPSPFIKQIFFWDPNPQHRAPRAPPSQATSGPNIQPLTVAQFVAQSKK